MKETILFLIPFLIQVESGGDWSAVGDKGKSLGALQIQRACWIDGTESLGVDWDYEAGAHDPAKAKAVCLAYLTRYGKNYKRKEGKEPTLEVLSRIWNSGPTGWKKDCSIPHWLKVKSEIASAKKEEGE